MAAPAPARRVLLLALASRVAVLGAMLLADWTFADLDTSSRLQGFPCAGDGGGDGGAGAGGSDTQEAAQSPSLIALQAC